MTIWELQPHQEASRWCLRTSPLPSETLRHLAQWITACPSSSLTLSPRSTTRPLCFSRCFARVGVLQVTEVHQNSRSELFFPLSSLTEDFRLWSHRQNTPCWNFLSFVSFFDHSGFDFWYLHSFLLGHCPTARNSPRPS